MESVWTKQIQDIQRQYDIRAGRAQKEMELARSEIRRVRKEAKSARNEAKSARSEAESARSEARSANQNTVLVLERLMSLQPGATPAMVLDQLGIRADQREELLGLYDERHGL